MDFNKIENDLEKVQELKTKMKEQLNEQMGIAIKIFIPLLTHNTHYLHWILKR